MVRSAGDPRGAAGLLLLSPGIVLMGALLGAVLAPSTAAQEEAEGVLVQTVVDPDLSAALRDCILQSVQAQAP